MSGRLSESVGDLGSLASAANNDPKRTRNSTSEWLKKSKKKYSLEWLSQSPDLNLNVMLCMSLKGQFMTEML